MDLLFNYWPIAVLFLCTFFIFYFSAKHRAENQKNRTDVLQDKLDSLTERVQTLERKTGLNKES